VGLGLLLDCLRPGQVSSLSFLFSISILYFLFSILLFEFKF
jgi:hypothetical protein